MLRLQSKLFLIAVDYRPMFTQIVALYPKVRARIDNEIQWAKKTLRKSDRVTWFLRWYRLSLLKFVVEVTESEIPSEVHQTEAGTDVQYEAPPSAAGQLRSLLDGYLKEQSARVGRSLSLVTDVPDTTTYNHIHQVLQHFFSLDFAPIQEMHLDKETFDDAQRMLVDVEREYKESEGHTPIHEGDQQFVKFPDGWAWWLLNRGSCDEEAKAMGHCGNAGAYSDERILSLRQFMKRGSEGRWVPHLTFIMDGDGFLGQMKGRGNDKPAEKYHPYILSLLRDKRIKGIKGGGYLPQNNFMVSDLPEADRQTLYAERPELMTFKDWFKLHGRLEDGSTNPEVFTRVQKILGINKPYDEERGGWVIGEWDNPADFVKSKASTRRDGGNTAQWIIDVMDGNQDFDSSDYQPPIDQVTDILHKVSESTVEAIGEKLATEYPDEVKDWLEQESEETFDTTDVREIQHFIEYLDREGVDNEVSQTLYDAYRYGSEAGTTEEMYKYLKKGIEDASDGGERISVQFEDSVHWMDSKIYAVLTFADALATAQEASESDEEDSSFGEDWLEELLYDLEVKVDQPYNGFSDYDESVAVEHVEDTYKPKNVIKPKKSAKKVVKKKKKK